MQGVLMCMFLKIFPFGWLPVHPQVPIPDIPEANLTQLKHEQPKQLDKVSPVYMIRCGSHENCNCDHTLGAGITLIEYIEQA